MLTNNHITPVNEIDTGNPLQSEGEDMDVDHDGPIDDSDDEAASIPPLKSSRNGIFEAAPSLEDIEKAHHDLEDLLCPLQRDKSQRYKDPGFDKRTTKCLEAMKLYCFNIIDMESKKQPGETGIWTKASVQTSRSLGFGKKGSVKPGTHHARQLQEWVQTFIDDREEVPTCNWKTSGRSLIDDKDFAQEVHAHLQSIGPYVSAMDIVHFINTPKMLARLQ